MISTSLKFKSELEQEREKKTRVRVKAFAFTLTLVFVLEAGLEPARPKEHRILSPACLPFHHSSGLCFKTQKKSI
jgi:hypothetical protein